MQNGNVALSHTSYYMCDRAILRNGLATSFRRAFLTLRAKILSHNYQNGSVNETNLNQFY